MKELTTRCDQILNEATNGNARVPGVVAMVTDDTSTFYTGVAGDARLGGESIKENSVFAIMSTTKAITSTTALQCVEEGLLDLDAPAKEYAPALRDLKVIDGFDSGGNPILRPPKQDPTTRQLLLHTAGFAYDFFDETYKRLADEHGQPSVVSATRASIETPLVFDPGERWQYGSNIDWVGQVVEGIRGKRLGEVMHERVFAPLDMHSIGFSRTDEMKKNTALIHSRDSDGSLTPMDEFALPDNPEVHMGGHGLYGTITEYMKFIRMWLNNGAGPEGQILKPETVEWAVKGSLSPGQEVTLLKGVIPTLSNDAEFFPGLRKDWSYSFMVNKDDAPTGRPAGSIAWAGLANCFYWIDIQNKIGGYWATQILPFGDAISFPAYLEFEKAVYESMRNK